MVIYLFVPVLWQFLHDSRTCMSLSYSTASENIHQVDCGPGFILNNQEVTGISCKIMTDSTEVSQLTIKTRTETSFYVNAKVRVNFLFGETRESLTFISGQKSRKKLSSLV